MEVEALNSAADEMEWIGGGSLPNACVRVFDGFALEMATRRLTKVTKTDVNVTNGRGIR